MILFFEKPKHRSVVGSASGALDIVFLPLVSGEGRNSSFFFISGFFFKNTVRILNTNNNNIRLLLILILFSL